MVSYLAVPGVCDGEVDRYDREITGYHRETFGGY